MMRETHIFPAERGWLWEVRIDARVVVIGWSLTRERAELQARMA
jgi:hypothetical protein